MAIRRGFVMDLAVPRRNVGLEALRIKYTGDGNDLTSRLVGVWVSSSESENQMGPMGEQTEVLCERGSL